MMQRRVTTALVALLLPSGTVAAAPAPAAPEDPHPVTPATTRAALPPEACAKTEDGFVLFLNDVVTDPTMRAAYSAPRIAERDVRNPSKPVARPSEPFRLTTNGSFWLYNESGRAAAKPARLTLTFTLTGNRMRLGLVKTKFSPEDEIIGTFGAPEAYVFEHRQGCWQLVEHLK